MRIGTADTGQATPNPCYSGSYGVTVDMVVNVVSEPFTAPTWAGDWILDPAAGALAVGPNAGSVGDWYASSAGDVDTRACLFDDIL